MEGQNFNWGDTDPLWPWPLPNAPFPCCYVRHRQGGAGAAPFRVSLMTLYLPIQFISA
jgi:hypothetical protein